MRKGYGSDEDDRESVLLYLHGQTEKAWRVSVDGDDQESFWLPKSHVDLVRVGRPSSGGAVEFLVPEWLRDKHDLD